MSAGSVEHELELGVPAIEAWDLFGTLRFRELAEQEMPKVFQKVELVEGDGGVGTVVKITLAPGFLSVFDQVGGQAIISSSIGRKFVELFETYICLEFEWRDRGLELPTMKRFDVNIGIRSMTVAFTFGA